MMQQYEVGKQAFPPCQDGVRFDMTDGGGVLGIFFSRPKASEKKSFQAGLSMRFRVVDDIIFLLVRMGTDQWMDAPYNRHLSRHLTHLDRPSEGMGLAVHAMLVDASTGVLVAQKLVGLSTDGSNALIDAIQAQPAIPDYDLRLRRVFSQYRTTDLLEGAVVLC